LVLRHLARVADLLENDDCSYVRLFGEETAEAEVQRWVASSLKLLSRRLYTVEREPQAQNDKTMDISIAAPGIARIPIEIKPLYRKRYSVSELEHFIEDQLIKRYMRPADVQRGIFFLVPLVARTWRVGKTILTYQQLCIRLANYAKKVSAKHGKEVVVTGINVAGAHKMKDSKAPGSADTLGGSAAKRKRRPPRRL
jgi:hypothetical protein